MGFRASAGSKTIYAPAPEGLAQAVLIDVIDKGYRLNNYDPKDPKIQRKVAFRFLLDLINEESGEPFQTDDWLTFSMHVKATMRNKIENGLGKKLSDDEAEAIEVDDLIGTNFQVLIVHNPRPNGDVFANVKSVMPVGRNAARLEVPEGYVRVVKDYKGSYIPDFDAPGRSVKLTDEQAVKLNAMPDSIRENLAKVLARLADEASDRDDSEAPTDEELGFVDAESVI